MDLAPLIQPTDRTDIVEKLRRQVADLMAIEGMNVEQEPDRVIAFRGRLQEDPEVAFERLMERFDALGYTPMLLNAEGGGHQVLAIRSEEVSRPRSSRRWVNVLLAIATFLTMVVVGLSPEWDFSNPMWYLSGLPFALTLMAILLSHELAHYFVARRYGSPVSLPYFVPMPISPFGTMGAVILQRAPMRDRKALFDIGVAGPLAGLLVALPLLILGLMFSRVGHPSEFIDIEEEGLIQEGNSLLYLGAKYAIFSESLPNSQGEDVWLSLPHSPGGPVAFAAWAGLFVTALNLLPIGQLDGGHVAYALLGRRAWKLAFIVLGLLGALGLYLATIGNPAAALWFVWVLVGLFMGPRHPPPLNDVTPLGWRRKLLGVAMAVIFIATFVPVPLLSVPPP